MKDDKNSSLKENIKTKQRQHNTPKKNMKNMKTIIKEYQKYSNKTP